MDIGRIKAAARTPTDQGRAAGAVSGKQARSMIAPDHAVISGPARERQADIARVLGALAQTDGGKSVEELESLRARLERGDFDSDQAVRRSARAFVENDEV